MPKKNMSNELELSIRSRQHLFSGADTKASVQEKLGIPDDVGGFFGKKDVPQIYKYEGIEFHFSQEGDLVLLYKENEAGGVLLNEKL